MAPRARPAKQAPIITQPGNENAPKWALGMTAIFSSLISLLLVLGMESIGGGLGDILSSRADSTRIESLTTAQMLQSMQASNVVLQQRVLQLESDLRRLDQENQELRTILKYEHGIVVTAVATTEPVIDTPLPPVDIALPTDTPNAVREFEEMMTPSPLPSIVATETITN